MGLSLIKIEHQDAQVDMERQLLADSVNNRFQFGQRLMAYVRKCMGGQKSVKMVVGINAQKASGTFTGTSVIATDAISINGVTFTAVASGATGNQFNIGADDAETMANLAAAINASVTALVSGYVTASSALTVCTVTAALPGILGNAVTIASADATIVASGARLTGGDQGATEKTYYFGSAS
jgi:hypothetical protein